MVPCNIWVLETPEMVLDYSLRGGKVIFITEDVDPRLEYIPNKLLARILLPPFEATELELDGRIAEASDIYFRYLSTMEPSDYISVIIAAVVQGQSIGLYFGEQLKEMQFPTIFLNYMHQFKGVIVGSRFAQPGYVREYLPIVLSDLYGKGLVSVDRFLAAMPLNMNVPPHVLPKLVYDLRVSNKIANNDYNSYFNELIESMNSVGRYLFCPMVSKETKELW